MYRPTDGSVFSDGTQTKTPADVRIQVGGVKAQPTGGCFHFLETRRSNRDEFFRVHLDLGKFHPLAVNFFSIDANVGRSGDAEPDSGSVHGDNRDGDAAINDNLFANFP
jgi:hypothetical protein